MKIGIGSDHAGYRHKEEIKKLLKQLGYEVRDFGTNSEMSVDYPAFIPPWVLQASGQRLTYKVRCIS